MKLVRPQCSVPCSKDDKGHASHLFEAKLIHDTDCEACIDCQNCEPSYQHYCQHHALHQASKINSYSGQCAFESVNAVVSRRSHSKSSHSHGHSHGHHGHDHQFMSVQGAMLHVITDIIQSVGVLLGSLLIYCFGGQGYNKWHLADPVCTLLFSALVIYSTRPLAEQMVNIIMHRNELEMRAQILEQFGVVKTEYMLNIHDLHVWELTPGNFVVTAHIVCKGQGENLSLVSKRLTMVCRELGIRHTTFQVESLENL